MTPDSIIATGMAATTHRLIVVSNRLPVSLRITDGAWSSKASNGGLASAMAGVKTESDFSWVGWPGCESPESLRDDIESTLAKDDLFPVFLSAAEEASYYTEYCNQILWPLFHYFTDKVTYEIDAWESYCRINRRFADKILEHCVPGDRVWIHDFHLMLVPGMLRAECPDLEIGFFMHIPWPSSEIFQLLPHREELLRGVLGADYVAFHTNGYAQHFRTSCLRVLGLDSDPDGISFENRRIGIGRNPIGIDTDYFRSVAAREATFEYQQKLRRRYQGRRVLLGVERLDYTKGVLLKLKAFERYLEKDPRRAETTTLLQVIVPSRLATPEYRDLKAEIEGYVGRINGRFGGPGHTPVEYIHREVKPEHLVALYQFSDVGIVTPVRDGMNLVAQEFVLCQQHGNGILILSEFAGAAQVLGESILVNPWNIERTADAITEALDVHPKEREDRMRPMIARVEKMDCKIWAREFLAEFHETAKKGRALRNRTLMSGDAITTLVADFARAERRIVLLDYDGTLRELTSTPELAQPTDEILDTVRALTGIPDTDVHIVSGRTGSNLETWFGELPVHLSCEHGSLYRRLGEDWQESHTYDLGWMPKVREMLEEVCREVPGSTLEQKRFSIAWHYRMADDDYGLWRSRELMASLEQRVPGLGLEVISGNKVIEVRSAGVNKGNYVRQVLEDAGPDTFILALGDDRTDIDMYRALPSHAVSVHVGGSVDDARFTIESPEKVRALLRDLVHAVDRDCVPAAELIGLLGD